MSCRTHALHSSSRSRASPGCSPAAAVSSNRPIARRATCSVCAWSMWYCSARLRTLDRRTSSNSGGSPVEVVVEEHALAQAGLGRLDRREAAEVQDRLDDRGAREDQVGARVLDARDLRALVRLDARRGAGPARSARRADDVALDAELRDALGALHGGGQVADGPADPDEPVAGAGDPVAAVQLARDVLAQRLAAASWTRRRRRGRSARSSGPRPAATSRSSAAIRDLTWTSCIEPPPRSSTAPSAKVVELTAAR